MKIEATEKWLVDAQAVKEIRGKIKDALDSDEFDRIAAAMIQKQVMQRLGLWDQDGEKLQIKNTPQPASKTGHKQNNTCVL